MDSQRSLETSPDSSELEKGAIEDVGYDGRREELEEPIQEGVRKSRPSSHSETIQNVHLQPSLQQTRSHSSARSARSYTDGYTHFEEQNNEKQDDATGRMQQQDKEFEVQFDGDSDPWNPKNKTTLRKWCIVLIGSACSLCVTCASALYTSTYEQMEQDYHVSREVATIGLTTYVCGLGLGPMFLSPLSEFYGRRIIYICAFGMFFIWLIPCAVAPEIGSMLVFRKLQHRLHVLAKMVADGTSLFKVSSMGSQEVRS